MKATRRGFLSSLFVAPFAKFLPKSLKSVTSSDVIGSCVSYNLPYLASIHYNKQLLERLRKKFVFNDFIKSTGYKIKETNYPVQLELFDMSEYERDDYWEEEDY